MKPTLPSLLVAAAMVATLPLQATRPQANEAGVRSELLLDDNWLFFPGRAEASPPPAQVKGGRNAATRSVRLPHDWSIEGRVSALEPCAGNGGFLPNGAAWYTRELEVPGDWAGRRVQLRLDGVQAHAEVWLDETKIAYHPYGYTPLVADLTPHLRPGRTQRIAVRADNSRQPNSRWYTGSGIYRHVWLTVTDSVAIAPFGVFARTTALDETQATVESETTVCNKGPADARLLVRQILLDPEGREVGMTQAPLSLGPGAEQQLNQSLSVEAPRPWSPDSPVLYTLVTRIERDGKIADELRTRIGLRTVRVSAAGGLALNGRRIVLNGGNLHHDNGPLGAAAFDRAEERKVELMKAAGFNAVRTAHNPPSPAFLDACDRLGLLVMDEAFDGWEKKKTKHDYGTLFRDWWKHDLGMMVRRDRNHPSIIMWSVGNEVFERGQPEGHRIARELADCIKSLDTSRPVTAGINDVPGKWEAATDPLFASLDVAGYNYETARHPADHARLPGRVIVLTESYQNEAFANHAAATGFPYVIGDFVWSALDYLGEAGIGRVYPPGEAATDHWLSDQLPWHGAACGDIDLTGWRKPSSHWRAVIWGSETLYAAVRTPSPSGKPWSLTKWSMPPSLPTWSWPHQQGKTLQVEVFSSHPRVRARIGERIVGQAENGPGKEYRALLDIVKEPGDLVIEALAANGTVAEVFTLAEAGPAEKLVLTADRPRLRADGQDLSFITVALHDAKGRWQPHTDVPVTYTLKGPAEIAGIGSADLTSSESYRDNPRRTWQGRALIVLRSTTKTGKVTLEAKAPGLAPVEITLRSE